MDIKAYYGKVREVEAGMAGESVVVVSEESADGGRAGVRTEVPRALAAKMIVEGSARAASEEEAEEYRAKVAEAQRAAERLAALKASLRI